MQVWVSELAETFQSTLSMRRATCRPRQDRQGRRISIHALHEESDTIGCDTVEEYRYFNPRSP